MKEIVEDAIKNCKNPRNLKLRAFIKIEYWLLLIGDQDDDRKSANLPTDYVPTDLCVHIDVLCQDNEWMTIFILDKNIYHHNSRTMQEVAIYEFEKQLNSTILEGINYGLTCI